MAIEHMVITVWTCDRCGENETLTASFDGGTWYEKDLPLAWEQRVIANPTNGILDLGLFCNTCVNILNTFKIQKEGSDVS